MNVIVTGATSQIGRFLLPRLAANGHRVIAICRNEQATDVESSIKWQRGDIAAGELLVWPEGEVLVHIAPLRLLPGILPAFFAKGGRRVVCFGTTSRYTKAVSANSNEQAFAREQMQSEQRAAAACAAAGVHWTLFRPTLIYGCELDRNVTLIARAIRRLGFFPLLGAANGLRQPVHADDLAAASVAVLDIQQTFGKSYDMPGGETLSYRGMVERIFAALNMPARFFLVPLAVFSATFSLLSWLPRFRDFNAEMARRMNDDLVFDSTAAMTDFGYSPRPFQPVFPKYAKHV